MLRDIAYGRLPIFPKQHPELTELRASWETIVLYLASPGRLGFRIQSRASAASVPFSPQHEVEEP